MAISRRLHKIEVQFTGNGTPVVRVLAIVTDDEENTSTGASRLIGAPTVINAAAALRDALIEVAAAAGKPIGF